MEQEKMKNDPCILGKELICCNLSVRAICSCKSIGIETVLDLVSYKKVDLQRFRNFGKKTVTELDDFVADNGLEWGTNYTVNENGEVVKVEQK